MPQTAPFDSARSGSSPPIRLACLSPPGFYSVFLLLQSRPVGPFPLNV